MKRGIAVVALIVAGLVVAAVWREPVAAQVRQPAPDPDVLPALLAEVRGLRAVMEQIASAGPRVQLALGRLQLQEQRVNNILRRLETVRASLVESQGNYDRLQQTLTRVSESVPQAGQPNAEQLKEQETHFKRETAQVAADVQRLTVEEAGLSAELATEQGRWNELNQRMEELERALTRR